MEKGLKYLFVCVLVFGIVFTIEKKKKALLNKTFITSMPREYGKRDTNLKIYFIGVSTTKYKLRNGVKQNIAIGYKELKNVQPKTFDTLVSIK